MIPKASWKSVPAFMRGEFMKEHNTETDGMSLFLWGNKIAEHRVGGLYITNCGYFTQTTANRLRQIPGVDLKTRRKSDEWTLNGEPWDGGWIQISGPESTPMIKEPSLVGSLFDLTCEWHSTSGWRGNEEPRFAVCGVSDTGMWDDSPCRTDVGQAELKIAKGILKKVNIPMKMKTCASSNVFQVLHYIVVPPMYLDTAKELVREYIDNEQTDLIFIA